MSPTNSSKEARTFVKFTIPFVEKLSVHNFSDELGVIICSREERA